MWLGKPKEEALEGVNKFCGYCEEYIASFIDLRKPLIVAANGPGIGAGKLSNRLAPSYLIPTVREQVLLALD